MEIEEKLVMYGLLMRELEGYNEEMNAIINAGERNATVSAEEHERLEEVMGKIEVIERKILELLK